MSLTQLGNNKETTMKLKSLNKKLKRLEASMEKDGKKLAKLQRKVEMALKAESNGAKSGSKAKSASVPIKKKRNLTPEGRAKLAALMKARWDAKRAATVAFNPAHQAQA
jgi:hypothetical protein